MQTSHLIRRAKHLLSDPAVFSKFAGGITLRPYQEDPVNAIWQSIIHNLGDTIVIMISRQAGKDEMLANLLVFIMARFQVLGGEIVVVNPTYKPQTLRAILRVENRLDQNVITSGRWKKRSDFMRHLGKAYVSFLSGDGSANVVGATASLLLIVNEAQDITPAIYDKKFAPMAASTNATRVIVGTAWTSQTLLARELRAAAAAADQDGRQRVFVYDADTVTQSNPNYGRFVQSEIGRLGRDHPFVRTQYFNQEIDAQVGLFNAGRLALMAGDRPVQDKPHLGRVYAFCIDVAGQDEALTNPDDDSAILSNPGRDSTTISIVELDLSQIPILKAPGYRVIARHAWTGYPHVKVFQLINALAKLWRPSKLVIDATGVGEGLWSMLDKAHPGRVIPVKFSQSVKSEIAWRFISIIETGRFHDCTYSDEALIQYQNIRSEIMPGPNKFVRWSVPDGTRDANGLIIHDDFVMADALTAILDSEVWYQPTTTTPQQQIQFIPESL